jgi:16S rRNA processing protein RimM
MKNRQLITIGTISKTHGFEGAVTVKLHNSTVKEPKINEPVFIVVDGIPVPFFVREIYFPGGDTLTIAFDDYTTPASVQMFKGCELKYERSAPEEAALDSVEGYTVYDTNSSFTATIVSIDEQPGQILATVETKDRELYIPLHPDLIVSVNHRKRTIKMSLPEGLTDINN